MALSPTPVPQNFESKTDVGAPASELDRDGPPPKMAAIASFSLSTSPGRVSSGAVHTTIAAKITAMIRKVMRDFDMVPLF